MSCSANASCSFPYRTIILCQKHLKLVKFIPPYNSTLPFALLISMLNAVLGGGGGWGHFKPLDSSLIDRQDCIASSSHRQLSLSLTDIFTFISESLLFDGNQHFAPLKLKVHKIRLSKRKNVYKATCRLHTLQSNETPPRYRGELIQVIFSMNFSYYILTSTDVSTCTRNSLIIFPVFTLRSTGLYVKSIHAYWICLWITNFLNLLFNLLKI